VLLQIITDQARKTSEIMQPERPAGHSLHPILTTQVEKASASRAAVPPSVVSSVAILAPTPGASGAGTKSRMS
jgi:hypothetical protein